MLGQDVRESSTLGFQSGFKATYLKTLKHRTMQHLRKCGVGGSTHVSIHIFVSFCSRTLATFGKTILGAIKKVGHFVVFFGAATRSEVS